MVVRNVNDAGVTYNKLGNHRFLRFTPNITGSVTMTLSSSNHEQSPTPISAMQRAGTYRPRRGRSSAAAGDRHSLA